MENTKFWLQTVNQINFNWSKNPNFKSRVLRILEENIKEYLYNLLVRKIYLKESTKHKEKIDKLYYVHINLLHNQNRRKEVKRQATHWEKIFTMCKTDNYVQNI